MRTRTKTLIQPPKPSGNYAYELRSYPGGGLIFQSDGTDVAAEVALGELDEIIEDNSPKLYGVRNCSHFIAERNVQQCNMGASWQDGTGYRTYYSGAYSLWNMYPVVPALNAGNISVSYPKTIAQLKQDALKAFYDSNETDNLLNLLEADQLVSGVKGVYDFLHRFFDPRYGLKKKNIGRGSSTAFGGKRVFTSGSNFELNPLDVSNVYLGWSFGFAPLISDLRKISRALPNIRANLRKLAKQSAAPYTVQRSCQGTLGFSYTSGLNGYGPDTPGYPTGWWHERLTQVQAPTRIVGVNGRRTIQYQTEEFQQLDYLISRFVATGPASLIWEKVPFSFVVDWFVDLSGLIIRLDNAVVSNGKQVLKCWSSESYETFVGVVKHKQAAFAANTSYDNEIVAQYRLRSYLRSYERPDLVVQVDNRFGKKQGSLLAALLHQKVASLRRRIRR